MSSKGEPLVTQGLWVFTVLVVLLGLPQGASASAEVVDGEYIVRFKPTGTSRVQQKLQGKAFLKAAFSGKGVFHLTQTDAALVSELSADPDVLYIEPNYRLNAIKPADVGQAVQDPGVYSQTYAQVGATAAWQLSSPSDANNRPIVAVIDTGLDASHPVFTRSNSVWVNPGEIPGNGIDDDYNGYVDDVSGWNFIGNNANFFDDENHGTHVAGIVLGATQNIVGAPTIESKIRIMPLKFLDKNGSGSTAAAVNAIYYAVNMGAKVINCSWGGSAYSRALHDALTHAYEKGVLVVTAAGNYTSNNDVSAMYPANYAVPSNVSVAATTDNDRLASFTNYGAKTVHLASPGVYVFSTLPGGWWTSMSGTSMAAPFVAGAAALALREAPDLTGYQLRSLLLASADPISRLRPYLVSGARINMENLLNASQQNVAMLAYQPDYSPQYLTDRSLASETTAGGGCGMIQAIGGGGAAPPPGSGAMAMLLLLSPLLMWFALRQKTPVARRRYDRYVLNSDMMIKAGDRQLVASLKTISMGGLCFDADEALEKGGTIQMKILGPDGKTAIDVEGHIVWSEKNESYGVQFDSVKEQAKATLFSWTKQLLKAS
ncbi:MAG: S8 family serine peptidase [Bdellovibrionaceae bacterium]|nr:S8 family serine peptidase [Pseudobdellovibrionaceae bacterium]